MLACSRLWERSLGPPGARLQGGAGPHFWAPWGLNRRVRFAPARRRARCRPGRPPPSGSSGGTCVAKTCTASGLRQASRPASGSVNAAGLANVDVREADALGLAFATPPSTRSSRPICFTLCQSRAARSTRSAAFSGPGACSAAPTFAHGETIVAQTVSRLLALARFPGGVAFPRGRPPPPRRGAGLRDPPGGADRWRLARSLLGRCVARQDREELNFPSRGARRRAKSAGSTSSTSSANGSCPVLPT